MQSVALTDGDACFECAHMLARHLGANTMTEVV
jgi:hypothetical protein